MIKLSKNRFPKNVSEHLDNLFAFNSRIIAGGAIISLLCDKDVEDYDFYLLPDSSIKVSPVINPDYTFYTKHHTKNADALIFNHKNKFLKSIKVQVVNCIRPENPEELFKTFDFTVCCVAYDGTNFYTHDSFFFDLNSRTLKFANKDYETNPILQYKRMIKYMKKGFAPSKQTEYSVMEYLIKHENVPSSQEYFSSDVYDSLNSN